jgi:hypothetical protein
MPRILPALTKERRHEYWRPSMRRSCTFVVVTVVAAVAAASGMARSHYIVHGTVGSNSTIALKDGVGHAFTEGRAGMYIISVTDKSSHDGFHLVGPGVSLVITGEQFVGGRTVSVTLGPGTHHYVSDAHPRSLRGTFVLKR